MAEKIYIVANPVSGAGKGKVVLQRLKMLLGNDSDHVVFETTHQGHGMLLAKLAVEAGADLIIAVGGDGTINEVVNGMFAAREPACDLGIVNCGSGAGVAQTLGLPVDVDGQLERIFHNTAKPYDVGKVSCVDENGVSIHRFFANECQAGISGAIVSKVGMAHKKLGGSLAFGLVSVLELLRYKATPMRVDLDGRLGVVQPMLGVVTGNGSYCAGGMQLTPGAHPADGQLDVLSIRDMNLYHRMHTFSQVYAGNHIRSGYYALQRAQTLTIVSDRPVWVETDGELIGKTPCSISILPGALRVRY